MTVFSDLLATITKRAHIGRNEYQLRDLFLRELKDACKPVDITPIVYVEESLERGRDDARVGAAV